MSAYNPYLSLVYGKLSAFAGLENFWQSFEIIYGQNYDLVAAEALRSRWARGDFSDLPAIEVLSAQTLGSALGAYAQSTNKIYLSDQFVSTATPEAMMAVILEEIGHSIDALVNSQDSPGDEGEIFAALVNNVTLTPTTLSVLQNENDKKYTFIDNNLVEIEQSVPAVPGDITVNVTIPEVLFLRTINSATVIEGGIITDVAIVFSNAPSGKVKILLESSDFTVNPNPIEFDPPGLVNGFSLSEIFSVDDDITQGQRDVTVTIRAYTDTIGINSGPSESFTVTILDNDFVVTNTNDSGEGSLRQAILNANAISGANTITFAGPVFTDQTPDTITLTSGQLNITDSVTITGPGANLLTISGNNASRIFELGNSSGASTYNLSGLKITGGNADFGAGIRKEESDNNDVLNLDGIFLTSNTALLSGGGFFVSGGVFNSTNSTISNNTSIIQSGGGALLNIDANFSNVTISSNNAPQSGGIRHVGLGASSYLKLVNTTIVNHTGAGLDNIAESGSTSSIVEYSNSIFANTTNIISTNLSGSTGASVQSLGYNISSDGTGNLTATGDKPNTNPLVGALQNNGGPTPTHALLPGSPAIGAGNTTLTTDQRGITRPQGTNDDIGAFEYVHPTVSLTATDITATEAAGNAGIFQLTRVITNGGLTGTLPVQLNLTGTASAGDYNFSASGGSVTVNGNTVTVTFDSNSNTVDLTATPIDDVQAEADETIILTLNSSVNYAQGANTSGTVTIGQNDFVVTNTNDSGEGSLRQAILNANAIAGANTITFDIPDGGVQTINLLSALPTITEQVTIDGTSQTDFAGTPLIELNGASAGNGANGLTLGSGSSDSLIKGLVINRFSGNAILVQGNNNTIAGNFIGTNVNGTSAQANLRGIYIDGGSNNVIGGFTTASRNLISGNTQQGIVIDKATATGNKVQGNYIGTNLAGTAALANGSHGIQIQRGSKNNIVGTDGDGINDATEGNLISGNAQIGVITENAGTTGNIIAGNLIGTNVAGASAIPNDTGIYIANGADNTRVGTNSNGVSDSLERNIISGNTRFGIWNVNNAGNHRISGNYIGTDINGSADLGNGIYGILINSSINNIIGGSTASDRNIISGNNNYGILIDQSTATGNKIQGNYIGTDASGLIALGNSNAGVRLSNGTNNNLIGTDGNGVDDVAEGNVISSNSVGISIASNTTTNNTIAGNKIGTNAAGTASLGNTAQGILISDAPNNTIGGTALNTGNLIVGNTQQGIAITGNTATGNKIQGNSLSSNGTLGIDLGNNGITANDLGDTDTGPNDLQNVPRLSLDPNGIVQGQLNSAANTNFRIEFFSNTNVAPSGYGEGQTFLNFISVTTDSNGNASFSFNPNSATNITATATNLSSGNTSEFSNVAVIQTPTFALLTDNFTALYNPNTFDLDYNLLGRQGGLFATTRWLPTDNAQVGNSTANIDQGNYLLFGNNGRAALDRNFNGVNAQGGLKISFNLAPNPTNIESSWWGGINLGLSEANKSAFINNNVPHFGILFRGNGLIQAFDGGSLISGASSGWGGTGNGNTLKPFSLELTDPTDGNPFDGIGQTTVEVFADSNLIYTYVKGNGGYSDNYINLGTSGIAGFDNFKIEKLGQVPFAENATGTVYTVSAVGDRLRNPSLVYSLGGLDKNLFNISATGEISFKVAPNFENPTDVGGDNIYNLTVIASDANLTGSQNVIISVTDVNEVPTIALGNQVNSLEENTDTTNPVKVADIIITDDALGTNNLSLSGNDATLFEIIGTELFIKAGTNLDFETQSSFDVTVEVDDPALGSIFDDSVNFSLTLTNINEIDGNNFANFLFGTRNNDLIRGFGGNDILFGNGGNDTLYGGRGYDYLDGGIGNDILHGGEDGDILLGGHGNDVLIGGLGIDKLSGGFGDDKFVYRALDEAGDVILDFNRSRDQLVLTELFTGLSYNGSNPIVDGYLRFNRLGFSTQVQIDADSLANGSNYTTLTTLIGVLPSNLSLGTNVVV